MGENVPQIESIIAKMTAKGEDGREMVWVGDHYSNADLLRDLRGLLMD